MTQKPPATIRFLGANRSYSDGAEDEVLAVLESAADRSDGSDELFRHAVDWPTTYHFSPRRSNILRPFEINKHHRVLEIGAGTGAVTRYLGERGADVTALEGESIRARAIAARCSDLANVAVVSGSLEDFHDASGFDLVVIVGVLEYAGPATSDRRHQLDFLRCASDLLRPDGTLVLAIENQIGLKYLLGYSEDHLNQPWVGVEGYPGRPAVCTVPRTALTSLLAEVGLPAQRWYYPYPDYKLPKTILAEQAFNLPASTELVDQLAGRPVQDLANPPTRFCDDRACHRVFLDAGLGIEVANSFLVAAARRDAALDATTDAAAVAWHFSSDRLKRWRRSQTVRRSDGVLRLTAGPIFPDASRAEPAWLGHDPNKDEEFTVGRTLEQEAMESSRNFDLDGLAVVVRRWHALLTERETPPTHGSDADIPFAPRPGRSALPPEYLDASLSNFVDSGDATVFIDREWRLGSQVDATLTRVRTLWYFALDLVVSGAGHPFGPKTAVNDLAIRLAKLAGLDFDQGLIEEFIADEARLQEVVTGKPAQRIDDDLHAVGSISRTKKEATANLPVSQIRRDLVQLDGLLHGMESQAEDSRTYQARLEREITAFGSGMAKLEDEYRRLEHLLKSHEIQNREVTVWARGLEAQIQEVTTWARNLEAQIQEVTTWARNLEAQVLAAQTRERALIDEAAEAERASARIRADRTALELRVVSIAREVEELRTWKQRALRRPLVRFALAFHRFFAHEDADDDEKAPDNR